ncbi:TniQ family protein [Streptomyces olivaceus]|nr:TniQ family protein [Streptomyces olivaceus]
MPGPLRVRPLPGEATASYLTRLAATYRLSPAQLLDGLCITGTEHAPPAACPASHASPSRTSPVPCPTRTLVGPHRFARHGHRPLAHPRDRPAAVAGVHRLHHPPQPARSSLRVDPPAAGPAPDHDLHPPPTGLKRPPAPRAPRHPSCPRTHPSPPERTAPGHTGLPELGIDDHDTLVRPPSTPAPALADAPAPAHHRQPPHLTEPGLPSPDLPGTDHLPGDLTLAAALDRLPPHPLTRTQQTAFLHDLAGRLRLPRLAPADHDLLWKRLATR